jgi:hypothetical protein
MPFRNTSLQPTTLEFSTYVGIHHIRPQRCGASSPQQLSVCRLAQRLPQEKPKSRSKEELCASIAEQANGASLIGFSHVNALRYYSRV